MLNPFQEKLPRTGGLAVRFLGSLIILAALVALMFYTIPQGNSVAPHTPDGPEVVDDAARRCEDHLADLMEGLSPGRLGISSDRVQVIDRLNAWRTDCGAQIGSARPSSDEALIKKLLSSELQTRTLSDRYLADDASHVRMCLLARDISTNIVEGETSNSKRAVALFNYVSRNTMLLNEEIRGQTPMTPYECLIFGMASAEDRAWIFAELLRQLRIDVVILTPQNEKLAQDWLVGVIDPKGGILLFDPRLGLPIPAADSSDETLYPEQPATLQSVLETDAPFRKLDLPENPYPLKSDDLKQAKVSLIGSSSGWAPRMALLQFMLPSGVSVDLYDGLGANELRSPGAYQRIVDTGKEGLWSEDQISIWPYSEKAREKFESTRGEGEENSQLAGLQVVFRGPYVPRPIGTDGKQFQPTPIDKSLHFVRIEQLKGNYSNAIRDYLPIRSTVKLVPSPANESAAEFATLWTGVSQYQTQKIRTALGTFDRYVTGQARSIGMSRVAIEFLADCLLTQKNYEAAVQVLEKAPPGFAPRRDQYLVRRWRKIGGLKETPAAADDKTKPEKSPMPEKEETQKKGEKPANGKPAEAPKAMEAKPDASAKPADQKADMKGGEKTPADGKSEKPKGADDKPADPKPAAEQESKPAPAEKPETPPAEVPKADVPKGEAPQPGSAETPQQESPTSEPAK